jgi:hypothetical protein
MKRKWQLPIILRLHRGVSFIWLGIEWRSPCYQPINDRHYKSHISEVLESSDRWCGNVSESSIKSPTRNPDIPYFQLNTPSCYIKIWLDPDDKVAFARWCAVNTVTMSQAILKELKPFINEGYLIK